MEQDYTPRKYSLRENIVMTAKVLGGAGVLGGIMWTLTMWLD
jgi:hypothetical protein